MVSRPAVWPGGRGRVAVCCADRPEAVFAVRVWVCRCVCGETAAKAASVYRRRRAVSTGGRPWEWTSLALASCDEIAFEIAATCAARSEAPMPSGNCFIAATIASTSRRAVGYCGEGLTCPVGEAVVPLR